MPRADRETICIFFRNLTESGIPDGIPEGRTLEYCILCHVKQTFSLRAKTTQKAGVTMTFCLLLLPCTAASRYTVLPSLLPLLEQRQQWRSWCGGAGVAAFGDNM